MFTIRPAILSDAEALPEIERSAGESFLDIPHLAWIAGDDVQSAERHRHLIQTGRAWVAEDPLGRILGFGNGERLGQDFHVWEVSVRRGSQGQGLGRALMNTAIEQARSQGLWAVTLTTFREVAWNEPFYRSLGFVTLDEASLTSRLADVLEAEAGAGLIRETRCAMSLTLA